MNRLIKKSKNQMTIVYAGEDLPESYKKSLYLAGPTPRSKEVESWRLEALEILDKLNYDGVVFVPEARDGKEFPEYDHQFEWENKMMDLSDCILFWVNRELRADFENIALTTNVEWGKYYKSGRVVIGFPKEAPKTKYLEQQAKSLQLNINYSLENTIKEALDMIGEGSLRTDGECYVPLIIWNTNMFKEWYKSQTDVGNELRYANINYVFKMPKAKKVFFWVLHVHVYIKAEDRIKENEFVVSRSNTCDAVLYYKQQKIEDTIIVLTKEFRSPANNDECYIYELPGGSSIKEEDNIDVIHDEIKEEMNVNIDKDRLIFEESRQVMGTLSSHKSYLYSVELNDEDMELIHEAAKTTHGVAEDTELTYIEIKTLSDIINNQLLDWANIGKILSILYKKGN